MKPFKHQTDCHQNTCRNFTKDHSLFCPCTCSRPKPTCPLCSRTDSHKHSAETTHQTQFLHDGVAMSEFPEKSVYNWEEEFEKFYENGCFDLGHYSCNICGKMPVDWNLKSFIRTQIAQAKEEERMRIKKLLDDASAVGYVALDELINKI